MLLATANIIENNSKDTNIVVPGLISTIIPVFNRANMLVEAVESVITQTYRPVEIIIVDDGSTDGTVERILNLTNKYPDIIRSARQSNQGVGAAREAGRVLARGEFIQYLDSDDLLLPDKFEFQIAALREIPEAGIAYGKTHHSGVGEELRPVPFKKTGEHFDTLFPALLISRWWSTSTPLYRRSVTDAVGPWQPLTNEEDWEYEARVGVLGVKLVYCDHFVSVTRWHNNRLYHGGTTDPVKLASRANAHALIFHHAKAAGISSGQEEMQHFARELFLLSRQCGAAGLERESEQLFSLSKMASGEKRGNGWDFRLYEIFSSVIGWTLLGKIACYYDSFRSR